MNKHVYLQVLVIGILKCIVKQIKFDKMWQMDQDGHGFWLISMLDPKDSSRIDIAMMSPNHLQQILELKSNTAGLT